MHVNRHSFRQIILNQNFLPANRPYQRLSSPFVLGARQRVARLCHVQADIWHRRGADGRRFAQPSHATGPDLRSAAAPLSCVRSGRVRFVLGRKNGSAGSWLGDGGACVRWMRPEAARERRVLLNTEKWWGVVWDVKSSSVGAMNKYDWVRVCYREEIEKVREISPFIYVI